MRASDIQILCQRYTWDNNIQLPEVNFFAPNSPTVEAEVDLMPCIKLNTLSNISTSSYSNIERDEYNPASGYKLFYEVGNATFEMTNLLPLSNGEYPTEYFKVYEDADRVKYFITIKARGSVVYRGFIYRDGITYSLSPSEENKTVGITILGFEKEFKAYYESKVLPDIDALLSPVWNQSRLGLPRWNSYDFKKVLGKVFDSPLIGESKITLSGYIGNWMVASFSYFCWSNKPGWGISPIENGVRAKGLWYIACGYRSLFDQGESRYGWFESVCLAMGWVFYFDTDGKLIVKNRADFIPEQITLEYENFISHTVEQDPGGLEIDNVIIDDGTWDGSSVDIAGSAYKGFRSAIHSNKNYYNNNQYWWTHGVPQGLIYQGGNYSMKHLTNDTRYDFFRGVVPESQYLSVLFRNYYNMVPSYTQGAPANFPPGYLEFSYKNEKTLVINPVINDGKTTKLTLNNVRYTETGTPIWFGNQVGTGYTGAGANQVIYSGNAANCLHQIYENPAYPDTYELVNYKDYIKSPQFRANFDFFTNRKTIVVLTVKYKGLYTNPLSRIQINGYIEEKGSDINRIDEKEFGIIDMDFDLLNEVTTLKLQELIT